VIFRGLVINANKLKLPPLARPAVATLGKLLDHLVYECRDVVRFSRCDNAIVSHDRFVEPVGASIRQVSPQ